MSSILMSVNLHKYSIDTPPNTFAFLLDFTLQAHTMNRGFDNLVFYTTKCYKKLNIFIILRKS